MTMQDACAKPMFRREHGSAEKQYYLAVQSLVRWEAFRTWAQEARRLDLRSANRRFRVHSGLSFHNA
jgi:hypothetical protein